jgi:hypothetical protein
MSTREYQATRNGRWVLIQLLLLLLFVVWIWGARQGQVVAQSLAFSLWDGVGAMALWVLGGRYKGPLGLTLRGLGLGWGIQGLADALYTLELYLGLQGLPNGSVRGVRQWLNYAGTAAVLLAGTAFPWAMEQRGLYASGSFIRLTMIALLGTVVAVTALSLIHPVSNFDLVFNGAAFFLALLFLQQAFMLQGGYIGEGLQIASGAILLVSMARVIYVLSVEASWSGVLSDLFWIAGALFVVVAVRRRP